MRHKRVLQQLTIDGQAEEVASIDLSPTWGGKRPGSGRPKGDITTASVSTRLPVATVWRIKKIAREAGMTPGEWMRFALAETVERYDPI